MISVDEALTRLFSLVDPLATETIALRDGGGRILREDIVARRDQPPFPASAMDGYAVQGDAVAPGVCLKVIGEAAAGHAFNGSVNSGEAVRIFTGAPVPPGATRIIIQEDVVRSGDNITLRDQIDPGPYIRPAGTDFKAGARIKAPTRLRPADLALAAAMNVGALVVSRKPRITFLATGDELVMPGETPTDDQIVASNVFGLKAMMDGAGAETSILPISKDNEASLAAALELAQGSDMLVTIGGASVGDHDLVAKATAASGMERSFYKVAMRPGKPLMAGKIGNMAMIGLPGNPVSAMVCGEIFLKPVVETMLGLPAKPRTRTRMRLTAPAGKNGPREHYIRATLSDEGVAQLDRQDSALLSVLARADALVVRPPNDPAREAGEIVDVIRLF